MLTLFFANGGLLAGNFVGSADKGGAYPTSDPQKLEHMAATIYNMLGIPRIAACYDDVDRPNHIYFGDPIDGLP